MKALRLLAGSILTTATMFCTSCADHVAAAEDKGDSSAASAREILRLEGSDETIIIYAGESAPRYVIESIDGRNRSSMMTLDELRAEKPELYERVRRLKANQLAILY